MKYSVKKMVGTSLATSAALAAFATTNVSADELYTISSGDTLSSISRKFDLPIADIAEANAISNIDLIIAGERLNIPTLETPVVAKTKRVADAANVYSVVAGDTLNKIAADFNTTAQTLRDLNGITGDLILVGQQLKVAGEVAQTAPVADTTTDTTTDLETPVVSAPVAAAPVNNYVADENGNYTVVAGDSINKISASFGVSAAELRSANGLSGDLIIVGQSLAIPGLAVVAETPAAEVVAETPAVEETVVEAPAVEETVVETPVVEEVVVEAPAVEETVVETPVVEETVVETPAVEEVVAETPVVVDYNAEADAAAEEAAAQAAAEEAAAQAAAEEAAAQAAAEEAAAAQAGNVTALLNNAYAQVGVPYLWGGKTPAGFDCSGFVYYVYQQTYGVNVGGSTASQQYAGPKISVSSAQPGDLIFWGSYGSPYHVAISLGNGQYIHSQRPGETVHSESLNPYWAPSFAVSMAAYN